MELEEQIRYEANRLLENRDQEIRELIKRNEDNEYINNRLQQEYHDLKADYELVFFLLRRILHCKCLCAYKIL